MFRSVMAFVGLAAPVVGAQSEEAPQVNLAPEERVSEPTAAAAPGLDPARGMQAHRFAMAQKTSLGGYGELHYNYVAPEEGDGAGEIDLHRLVVFIAHNVSPRLRFYSEIEVEHAFAGDGLPGEVGVEQAFIDYDLLGAALTLRAGVVLVPMGIINPWHEPPIFHGVERPQVDRAIIPSTWREGGAGVVGKPCEGLAYELYVVGGLNPLGFSAGSGLRGGRQQVAEARANAFALTGRVEYEPLLGTVVGAAGYYGEAGPNMGEVFDVAGRAVHLRVPVLGLAADARGRWRGIEARALVATFSIGNTGKLREIFDDAGDPVGPDVGARLMGYYVEVGYDVLSVLKREEQLVPFVRYEIADTMARIAARDRTAADDARRVQDLVAGVSYRPLPQVAFKADVIIRQPGGDGVSSTIYNAGVGFMF